MITQINNHRVGTCQGFILLAVLVFILLLSMITMSLLFRSSAEESGAHASVGSEQAWMAAMSGVAEAMRVAAAAVPGSTDWADNPAMFRERLVVDDGSDRWYFTVFSPGDSESLVELRHGISDEAAKVNLNHPGALDLTKIPRMTAAMARAVRERVGGTENLPTGASLVSEAPIAGPGVGNDALEVPADLLRPVRRGRLGTLDELAGIPGFSRFLVYGEDANLNGRLDPNEDDGDELHPPDNKDGRLDHGMAQYFTVLSYEPNRSRAGKSRTDLNKPLDLLPKSDLPAAFTNYVGALRSAKMELKHPSQMLEAVTRVKNAEGNDLEISSGVTKEDLPWLLDLFSGDSWERHSGLVNINTAGAFVLATVPGVDRELAETIISTRATMSPDRRMSIGWLYQEGLVDAVKFKTIAPHLTASSYQFSFHVIGYGVPSGRYRVLDVAIDVAFPGPRVLRMRDITRLGPPFRLAVEASDAAISQTSAARP